MLEQPLLTDAEAAIRLGAFIAVFVAIAAWERFEPSRAPQWPRVLRWRNNLALGLLNVFVLRALFPLAAIGVAFAAESRGWGLFNRYPAAHAVTVPATVIVLDLAVWLQHRLFHAIPVLWRLHRVHHADPDFDVTTGVRFHPFEIVLSFLIKAGVIAALGAPAAAVIVFETVLSATSLFTHANASLPPAIERWVRLFVVTPDMHRIHHSAEADEMNRNFGFNLSVWDRVFGTYRDRPRQAYARMSIGLPAWRGPDAVVRMPALLSMPFRGQPVSDAGADPDPGQDRG